MAWKNDFRRKCILQGNTQKGTSLIKEGWITAEMSKSELRFFEKNLKSILMQMIILKELT